LASRHAALLPFPSATVDLATADVRLTGLLQAYGYLIAAVSYIGAEQALCSVFHSFVCFSHRETFYYANFSFAGEAVFRLYRHSYPLDSAAVSGDVPPRPYGWRTDEHRVFFPELNDCRQEIIADLDYIGMSTDPSLCSAVRKNETRFYELDQLTVDEVERLVGEVRRRLDAALAAARLRYLISGVVAVAAVVYVVLATVAHCIILSRCVSARCCCCCGARNRKRKENERLLEASTIYGERPVEQSASTAPADDSCCTAAYGGSEVDHVPPELTSTPSRTLADNLANDITSTSTLDCNHRRQLSPPPPPQPNFPAVKVACV